MKPAPASLHFSSIGNDLTLRIPVAAMSDRDAIMLFRELASRLGAWEGLDSDPATYGALDQIWKNVNRKW